MAETMNVSRAPAWAKEELDRICAVLEREMERYGTKFPSACAEGGVYSVGENDDWTNGFWTAMLWMAYQYTGQKKFRALAEENIKSFEKRLEDHVVLEHHDIGFLYSLSVWAGYRITGDERLKSVVIKAADVLADRYQEKGGFIQAWGKKGAPGEYRLIIDSLMNLPLLYRASEISGDPAYREMAESHYKNVIQNIVREDCSTYHTFYFDPETGLPDHGATHQGFSDQSCWARGQAWAIPYWDLIFGEGSDQPRDRPALAIAACGMLEMQETEKAYGMLKTLIDQASTAAEPESEGLLLHGVYAYAEGKGVDEPDLWGDYFYMEALCRVCDPDWIPYW